MLNQNDPTYITYKEAFLATITAFGIVININYTTNFY